MSQLSPHRRLELRKKFSFNLGMYSLVIDTLKALLLTQQHVVAGLTEQLNTRAVEIEHLKLQTAKLRRMQFGRTDHDNCSTISTTGYAPRLKNCRKSRTRRPRSHNLYF